jgi:Dodecin
MAESVYRVTELVGVSSESWEAAARNAVTSRLRADAALNELAPPRPPAGQRKRGRPPKKGARLRKLEQIATDPPPNGSRRPSAATARSNR